ncbi:TolC family protein [Persephonella sp. IF05-L8]|uniref:TolC family protein n=1 Tax=Persephonella sp. IF05-L8 TaxID=1158338 RepID=UPI00049585CA
MLRILSVFLLFATFAIGETIDDIIQLTLKNNGFIKSASFKLDAVKGELKKAKALPNPEISVELGRLYSQAGDNGINITTFEISQPLRLWGDRKFEILSVKQKEKAFSYILEIEKNKVISEVYKNFYTTLALKEKLKVKEQEIQNLSQMYEFLKKSYEAGEITSLNLLRVEKELELSKIQLAQLKQEYQNSLNTLSSLSGKKIEDIEGNLFSLEDIKSFKKENIPRLKYLEFLIKSIDFQIKRQKALSKPQIKVGLVISEDEVDLGKYDAGISITSEIPVIYRRQGEIIKLVNNKKELLFLLKQEKNVYNSQIENTLSRLDLLKTQITKLEKNILPTVKEALKLAEESYKLQTTTYLDYSNARKQYFETLLYKIDLAKQYHLEVSTLIKIGGSK